jgi:hypothetical protein
MMQSMCAICRHSQRTSIDENLRAGRDLRTLADEFGVRTTSLRCTCDARGQGGRLSPGPPSWPLLGGATMHRP